MRERPRLLRLSVPLTVELSGCLSVGRSTVQLSAGQWADWPGRVVFCVQSQQKHFFHQTKHDTEWTHNSSSSSSRSGERAN